MEQSPSWEANRFSARQEIPRIMETENSVQRLTVPILSESGPHSASNSKDTGFDFSGVRRPGKEADRDEVKDVWNNTSISTFAFRACFKADTS